MSFEHFKVFVFQTIEIVSSDLYQLQKIAEKGNETVSSATLTVQTTIRPDDENTFSSQSLDISRCTIPIAMVCFSVIDMIGQWLKEKQDDDFGGSAYAFFIKLSKKDDLNKIEARNKLKDFFRHGIMHSFFATKGFSVAYPSHDNNSLFIDINSNGTTLDVRYLLKVVCLGLNNLKSEIVIEKSELSQIAFKGYERWLNK